MLLFILVFILIYVMFSVILTLKAPDHMAVLLVFILGFTVYSGLGIVFHQYEIESTVYLTQYILSCIAFLCVGIGSSSLGELSLVSNLDDLFDKHRRMFIFAAWVYIGTFIFVLLYEHVTLSELFDVAGLFKHYTATSFSLRVSRSNDSLYRLIAVQLRGILTPFYYIYLYQERRNTPLFLTLFLLPIYCTAMANHYISRNEIAVYSCFILVYCISEKRINRYVAVIGVILSLPIVVYVFATLQNVRSFGEGITPDSLALISKRLFMDECSYPQYYPICDSMFSFKRTIAYYAYVITSFVPSRIQSFFGINTVDLAHVFTKRLIGLGYGDAGYYILLPSVLGEAIILSGKNLAWTYVLFYGFMVFFILRVLKSSNYLFFMKVAFILDFLREFRGGSQYLLTKWITTVIPFLVILFIVRSRRRSVFPATEQGLAYQD